MKFAIDEHTCIECGACRRYCPVDCIRYENMQHQVELDACVGCTICFAVCPADAVLQISDGRIQPDLSWRAMEKVRMIAFKRGPHQIILASKRPENQTLLNSREQSWNEPPESHRSAT